MKRREDNPFKKIPTILFPEELMNKAYNRAEKAADNLRKSTMGFSLYKARVIEDQKVRTAASVVADYLSNIVKKTPSLDNLNPFYREIVEILIDTDEFKKSLGAINWASQLVRKLGSNYSRRIRRAKSPQEASKIRKEFFGRVSSVLKQIYPNLACIAVAREKLKNIPTVKDMPTVVIAGYPNVGKSSLLRRLTDAEPEVNSYPFTTKGLNIGYSQYSIQFIDTPGILDRPIYERNDIELHAVVALNYLADAIVYVIDPTEYCGYTIDEQLNLLNEIIETFDVPVIVAINKIDIDEKEYRENLEKVERFLKEKNIKDVVKISTEKGINLDKLKRKIIEVLRSSNKFHSTEEENS
ncbi:MAG TPA: NOG1 family protein [Methanothermococcus okinawensis]|uniref:NOG1 family protein n=1 Tax=Methanothermococcus okinawensis TaxID=155863 RepID=A0A832ZJX8_9EURY|nr:NOG1 family protein [Methanococcaceae archaeon]HIP83950.1 NOG1 family protein [Methanothermococcus okinawensis]HIP91531.1 NOG1 family protein [Methanothermococcus okinawensis]